MKLTLGISPCPNDTFIFDALLHKKIDTEGLEFDVHFADVEKLNKWSFNVKFDITKLSFNAFSSCISHYCLLDSGSALGKKCGPLLVKKAETTLHSKSKIVIPGKNTTANLLLSVLKPSFTNKYENIFSEIENEIISGKADAGLIIHENRFTFKKRGLVKVFDLGELWEIETALPIPLGGIAVSRKLSDLLQKKIERVLRRSVEFAFENPESSRDFVKLHSQELEDRVIDSHINLYVNDYTRSLSKVGRKAICILFQKKGINTDNIFL